MLPIKFNLYFIVCLIFTAGMFCILDGFSFVVRVGWSLAVLGVSLLITMANGNI